MKILLIFLLSVLSIFIPHIKGTSSPSTDSYNLLDQVGGSKRKFSESQVKDSDCYDSSPSPSSSNKREDKSIYYYNAIRKVFDDFNTKVVPEYTDPVELFFDKFIRRSFYIKISNFPAENDIWFWDLPYAAQLSCSWHMEAFFFFILNKVKVAEHVLVEYLEYLKIRCNEGSMPTKDLVILEMSKYAIEEQYGDLFEVVLKSIKSEMTGLMLLLLLKAKSKLFIDSELFKWQQMCMQVVKKFPIVTYESALRLNDFSGATLPSKDLFIHFLPILRTLSIKSKEEFDADLEMFDMFALFQLGDLESKLPMGSGGLSVVNQMFLRSRINLSAFSLEKTPLKREIFERLFDALFLGLEPFEVIKIVYDNDAFSVFEAFCKYQKTQVVSENLLLTVMEYFVSQSMRPTFQNRFILALICYFDFSSTLWTTLKGKFIDQPSRLAIINRFSLIDHVAKQQEDGKLIETIDLSQNRNIEFTIRSDLMDFLSDKMEDPIQLDVGRFFLARFCGIPLEMTEITDCTAESFEWSEVVGFINFFIERAAGLTEFSGDGHAVIVIVA